MVEYLSGGRIQGSSTADAPTVTDDLTTDDGWVSTSSDWAYNASDYLYLDPIRRSTTSQQIYIDLQDYPDFEDNYLNATKWVTRFKFETETLTSATGNAEVFIGLSDTSGASLQATNQDMVYLSINGNSNEPVFYFYGVAGTGMLTSRTGAGFSPSISNSTTTFYCEIVRNSDVYTARVTTSDDYTGGSTATITKSGLTDLRWLKLSNDNEQNGQTWKGKLHEVKIYNGVTSAASTTSSAAPPANTRYEEVDTRKIYRWATGGTIWEENATRNGGEQTVNQSGWQNYNAFKVPSSLAGKKVKSVVVKCHAQSTDQTPTGTISAHIYNGTTKKAESDTINTSTLATGSNIWATATTCTFTGGTLGDYTLQTGDYVAVVANTVRIGGGYVQTASTDSQGSGTNRWYRTGGGSWTEDTNNTMYMTVTAEDDWKERGTA